ncbi:MAG: hypothetical protein FIB06_02310 [Betaproteobacteria bacterium]|nr:hypothetical protein [Betaproteobacteria bacterium]
MSRRNFLIDLIGLLLIALVVVVGYKLSPVLLPKADVVLQPEPGCDLQRAACAANVAGGGRIAVDSSLRPIPLAKPFRIDVNVTGLEARRVEVDFAGVDMNMGLIRPALHAEGGGRFAAELSLPVCITGAMDWQATVLVETAGERLAIPLRFRAGQN